MQSHYIELSLIPSAEMLQSELMGFVLENIHKEIVKYQGRIGLSFPAYLEGRTLGATIRLFGNENDIGEIFVKLQKLADYVIFQEPNEIPKTYEFATFSRYRPKIPTNSDLKRMELRSQKAGFSEVEIYRRKEEWLKKSRASFVPFVYLKSSSTEQRMPLFIKMQKQTREEEGIFNSYGLSKSATVPIF